MQHGEYGWYIGPEMEHYRRHKVYIPKTRAELISYTVEPPPKTFHMPQMSYMDATYHAKEDLVYALQNSAPVRPLVKLGFGNKEDPSRYIQKSKPPRSTSEGASQGGRTKETARNELGRNPNEKDTIIKSIHQCRTS